MAILAIGYKIVVAFIIAAAIWYVGKWVIKQYKGGGLADILRETIKKQIEVQAQQQKKEMEGKVKECNKKQALEADYRVEKE